VKKVFRFGFLVCWILPVVLRAADVDDRTIGEWTNYLNSKTSLNGPKGPGWKKGRGDQAVLEEDLRRIYFHALASGDEAAQDKALEELMVVNPQNSDYRQWKKLSDASREPEEKTNAVQGTAVPYVPIHTNRVGRLEIPGPEFHYEWDLVMPAEVQADVLQQVEAWRKQKKPGWSTVQIRAGSATGGSEAGRRLTVFPLSLWQANELTTFVREKFHDMGTAASKIPAPDLVMINPKLSEPDLGKKKGTLAQMLRMGRGQGQLGTSEEPTYSFTAKGLPVVDALALFAKLNQLNIVPDPEVSGTVTVDFRGLTLDKAMEAILESLGAYAEEDGGLIRVRGMETRIFTVDYLRLKRSGKTTFETDISSGNNTTAGGGGGGGSSGGSGSSGKVSVDSSDEVDVWKDMELQLKTLVSEQGKIAVNSLAGTVVVTDRKRNLERVANYMDIMTSRITRQVDLDVRVLDVEFTDDREFAIDWNRVVKEVGRTTLTASAILTPSGIATTVFPGLSGTVIPNLAISNANGTIDSIIKAIEDQGKVRVASQPRVRSLNHQTAVIKVVRQDPFFTSQSNVLQSQSGNAQGNNVQVDSVETGTVLAITPQISDDQKIMLEILPSVSTLTGTESFTQNVATTNNTTVTTTNATAPKLRQKQASTVVRVNDLDTVVMGGFIEETVNQIRKKVPILGDIPLMGTLFTGMVEGKNRREMVFLVSPSIVRDLPVAKN
jgi:MSHA type pilus biogenesis protein MshL